MRGIGLRPVYMCKTWYAQHINCTELDSKGKRCETTLQDMHVQDLACLGLLLRGSDLDPGCGGPWWWLCEGRVCRLPAEV